MRKQRYRVMAAGAAALLAAAVSAHAAENAKQLMDSHGCFSCHAVDMKIVGPAFSWVAYHYQGKKGSLDTVANFIIDGGVGYWKPWTGTIPMPSHPNITKDQAKTIAKWVLSQKPVKPPAP